MLISIDTLSSVQVGLSHFAYTLILPTLNSPTKNKFVSFRLLNKKILTKYRKVSLGT